VNGEPLASARKGLVKYSAARIEATGATLHVNDRMAML